MAVLAFGVASEDARSLPWAAVSLALCALPLALQVARSALVRVYALWFGVLVVAQSLLTPWLRGDHVSLPPRTRVTVDVRTDDIPGYPRGLRAVHTDERGWRVQPPVDYARPTRPLLVAIGGSTTEDIVLDDRATWTHRLQGLLAAEHAGVGVVNTGVSGLRAANHVATLQRVADLRPDLVLLLLGANDWNRHIRDHFEPDGTGGWRPPPLRETLLLRAADRLLVAGLRALFGEAPRSGQHLVIRNADDLVGERTRHEQRQPRYRIAPASVAPGYAADLERLGAACLERRLRCLFLTQPHAYHPAAPPALVAKFWMTPPYATYGLELESMRHVADLYNAHLRAFAARSGQGLCDVAAGMPPARELFYDDMHFTDTGAARVAELVAPCVREALREARRGAAGR